MEEILKILPCNVYSKIKRFGSLDKLQEIRLKINAPVILNIDDKEYIIQEIVKSVELNQMLQRISNFSVYAYDDEIRQGYITMKGGYRIGISGEYSIENGKIKSLKNIYSLNIRIAREVIGCSDKVMKYICDSGRVLNTILISPPKCGKTTLLRDIARNISEGRLDLGLKGKKVAVIDERSEIAACYLGVPQMNLGLRTDVFDGCMKNEGMMMAIRSMSPEVIICDEIGTKEDIWALEKAFLCGVKIITSIHGEDVEDIYRRDVFSSIIENKILDRAIVLNNRCKVGNIEKIYDFKRGEEYKIAT